ncbi:MAG: 7-carboxy-7-deazaguanine synthase QueE [Prevotellaceae bacterium]|jgi:organic radical activating enzyme|nr:7-carboxy-7-deazaguanine synthase QueE [Prevotellaceae bacterium]
MNDTILNDTVSLPLAESFYSLQGEGCHNGKAAFFIRLAGCDVCCSFCDSKTAWNVKRSVNTPVTQIVDKVMKTAADTVIVTGGEPSMYNLQPLCRLLKENGKACFIETAGNHPLTGEWDWICLSPKLNSPPLVENLRQASELKVVIQHPADFEWAEENAAMTSGCLLFLQPEWSVHETVIPYIIDYIKQHTHWILSLQMHKYAGIE